MGGSEHEHRGFLNYSENKKGKADGKQTALHGKFTFALLINVRYSLKSG